MEKPTATRQHNQAPDTAQIMSLFKELRQQQQQSLQILHYLDKNVQNIAHSMGIQGSRSDESDEPGGDSISNKWATTAYSSYADYDANKQQSETESSVIHDEMSQHQQKQHQEDQKQHQEDQKQHQEDQKQHQENAVSSISRKGSIDNIVEMADSLLSQVLSATRQGGHATGDNSDMPQKRQQKHEVELQGGHSIDIDPLASAVYTLQEMQGLLGKMLTTVNDTGRTR